MTNYHEYTDIYLLNIWTNKKSHFLNNCQHLKCISIENWASQMMWLIARQINRVAQLYWNQTHPNGHWRAKGNYIDRMLYSELVKPHVSHVKMATLATSRGKYKLYNMVHIKMSCVNRVRIHRLQQFSTSEPPVGRFEHICVCILKILFFLC